MLSSYACAVVDGGCNGRGNVGFFIDCVLCYIIISCCDRFILLRCVVFVVSCLVYSCDLLSGVMLSIMLLLLARQL